MKNISLRDMQETDCQDVSRLVCASFRWGAEREGMSEQTIKSYFSQRGSEDAIREQLKEYRCLIACSDKTMVGVVAIKENEITKLYVDPNFIRQGIGMKLFNAAEHIITEAGYDELILGVVFESSIPFYQAMGMSTISRTSVDCGPLASKDSILMRKQLDG